MCFNNMNTSNKYALERLALENLELLSKNHKEYHFVIDGMRISEPTNEDYDAVFTIKELEFPAYLSFQVLLNYISESDEEELEDYTKERIIEIMDDALNELSDYVDDQMDNKINCSDFITLFNKIDEKYDKIKELNNTYLCTKIRDLCIDWKNNLHREIWKGFVEVGRYLRVTRYNRFELFDGEESDGSDGSEESEESEDAEDSEEVSITKESDGSDGSEDKIKKT